MAKQNSEYTNWLDDAFDDKKAAEELKNAQMTQGSKVAIVVCAVIIVFIVMLFVIGFTLASSLTSLA